MKTIKNSQILLALIALISLTAISCSKEDVKGCTDPDGVNYNSKAEEDDGTCMYEGRGIIYFTKEESQSIKSQGIVTVFYTIDSEDVGSLGADNYADGIPSCGDANSGVTFTKKGMTQKSQTVTLGVSGVNLNGDLFEVSSASTYTITANGCTPIN